MIFGLYLATPIIKVYISNTDMKNIEYFLIFWFLTNGILIFQEYFTKIKFGIPLDFFGGYIGYYILGYYLNEKKITENKLILIYVSTLLSFVATVFGTYYLTQKANVYSAEFESYFSPTVILMSIGLFLYFKNINFNKYIGTNTRLYDFIIDFSYLSFGIYLMHALILDLVFELKINAVFINPLIGIPLTTFITVSICFFIAKCFSKIPILKKILI